jgi:cytoskeletal protein CcmA (bactofilin family)
MWKRKTARKPDHLTVVVGEGSEVDGRCRFSGVSIVEGRVSGDLLAADELIVGQRGQITATVRAQVVIVRGAVTGNIIAADRVELASTAHVVGDIETPALTMADGAILDGHCRITRTREDAQQPRAIVALAQ